MHWSVKIVAVAAVCSPPVWACCQRLGQQLAPGDGARIPANTRFFVDGASHSGLRSGGVERTSVDGVVVSLTPSESGEPGSQFYAPGPLRPGETFFLSDAGVRVEVTEAAAAPTSTGLLVFGAAYSGAAWCDFVSPPRLFVRDVFLQLDESTDAWRDVGRVRFSQRTFASGAVTLEPAGEHFGALAADAEGFGAPVGRLVADCDAFPGRHEFELEARFETPGETSAEPARQRVVMDCAERPPVGCTQSPAVLMGALAALLARRRRVVTASPATPLPARTTAPRG